MEETDPLSGSGHDRRHSPAASAIRCLDAINKLPEERLSEIDFDTLSKNAVALTRAVAYKKNVDTKTRDLLENGAEQFKDLIYEAMAAERPDLYKEVKKFIKSKAKEGKA